MNAKRVSYVLPLGHEIRITGNYLVGLLEGDGSFYFNKQDPTVRVTLVTTTPNRVLLEKIREFLISHLDEYSGMLASCTKLINILFPSPPSLCVAMRGGRGISDKKIKGENKPISYPSPLIPPILGGGMLLRRSFGEGDLCFRNLSTGLYM